MTYVHYAVVNEICPIVGREEFSWLQIEGVNLSLSFAKITNRNGVSHSSVLIVN